MKTSSRSGRFKKKLVSENSLQDEAPFIEATMTPIIASFEKGELSPAEFTAIYLIAILAHRSPKNWPGARRPALNIEDHLHFPLSGLKDFGIIFEKNVEARLADVSDLGELLNNFALKSTPETVNRSLLHWSTNAYPLELMSRIPNSLEVLAQQTVGRRCVSVLTSAERCRSYILGERDPLSFTMHDLIHADHFYHNPVSYEGQLGFYGLMDFCLKENHFSEQMKNPKFSEELDYLISDMNAYAIHLLKCFKAALFHYHDNGEAFLDEWLKKIKANTIVTLAFKELLSPLYYPEVQDQQLLDFLAEWKVRA